MNGGPVVVGFFFLLFLGVIFFGQGLRIYTDWLWFQEVGALSVFLTELKARFVVGGGLAAAAFAWLAAHFVAARASRNRPRPIVLDDWLDFPERHRVLQKLDAVFPAALAAAVLMAGVGLARLWDEMLLFRQAASFGAADPVFGLDAGFYAFRLPFWQALHGLGPYLLLAAFAVAAGVYALQRDIQLGDDNILVSRPAQVHFAVLAAVFFLWKAVGHRLAGFDMVYAGGGLVSGAGYADIHARLPVLRLLQGLSALAAVSFLVPVFRAGASARAGLRPWLAPLGLSGLWLATSILGSGVYPALLQKFRVAPNEISLERPYLERGIEWTRRAYGLDSVREEPFPASGGLTPASLERNRSTLENVRLWDHRPLLATFGQLQEIRTYYKFLNVDNDRYRINGDYRQVMLSVRELDHRSLPSRIWINEHLTYTHGYGLVLGPVNEVTSEGLPRLFVRDIPPRADEGLEVTRPEVYFGEVANDYVLVNTRAKELDYASGDKNVYSDYKGTGGIPIRHFLRQAAFALRFGDTRLVLSRDITAESRLLMYRRITDRVRRIAPFFLYDTDPYAVLLDGRILWVLDGYTWTDRYPYSQSIQGAFNYIRNSVKAVVDAYDGSVTFYAVDDKDPMVRAYGAIYPGLLRPAGDMPEGLRAHLRYPQDLFEVQSAIYARYHMGDPQVFYNQEDLWAVPHEILEGGEVAMEPYYTVMRLPGETREEYILMRPFVPARKSNMIAWMAARSDPPHYGELLVYRFPKEKLVYGPMQIEARIDQDSQISQQFTFWGQRGVQILRGNLLVIPVEDSLLYIEPVYLQAERGKIPELRRVIVAYEDRIVMGETLDEALRGVFGRWTGSSRGRPAGKDGALPPAAGGPAGADVPPASEHTRRAWDVFRRGQEALRRGDWAAYGDSVKELEGILKRMKEGS